MTVRDWWQSAAGILSAASLAAWVGQSVVAQGARPALDGVDTIPFAYFLNDGPRPIDDCTFSIVTDGHAPARVAVDRDRLRVGGASGMRRLDFRCGDHPTDDTASIDLFSSTDGVVFIAYSRPQELDKELKRNESKWPEDRWDVLYGFYDARELLRSYWLAVPRSAREKAGGAFVWRASGNGNVRTMTTFRYAARQQPTALPAGLAGSWSVKRRVSFRRGDDSPATADAWVGRTARFAAATAEFGQERCATATYVQMTVDPEKFFLLVGGYSIKDLGLKTKKAAIVSLSCAGAAWNAPSGFVVRDKNHVLAFHGGVFFEMARAN